MEKLLLTSNPIIKSIGQKIAEFNLSGLPGIAAHSLMAPKLEGHFFRNMTAPANARKSAVLIPLIVKSAIPEVLFTIRSKQLKHHSGQISFPGGRIEKGETPLQAALRETDEEIGINVPHSNVIAELSPLYVEPSNNLIFPFLAVLPESISIKKSEDEVEDVLTVPLNYFIDPNNRKNQKRIISDTLVEMPFWDIGADVPLWGATAMILSELIEIIIR